MVLDVSKDLVVFLPQSLSVSNGDTFTVDWIDGMARHLDLTPPYGTFSPISTSPIRRRDMSLSGPKKVSTVNDTDTFMFTSSQLTYEVEQKDISVVNTVTGTLGGNGHTFVENTDYKVVSTGFYSTKMAIKWFETASDLPDEGTNFTVDYDYRLLTPTRRTYEHLSYRLGVHAKQFASTESPATKGYNATDLAMQLGDSLAEFFTLNKGSALDTNQTLRFLEYERYGVMSLVEGESTAVDVFDIIFTRKVEVDEATIEAVGDVEFTTDAELIEGDGYGEGTYGNTQYSGHPPP